MTKRATLLVIAAVASASFPTLLEAATIFKAQGKPAPERKSLIGTIRKAPFGCGCGFSLPSERGKRLPRPIFSSDIDEQTALMNIDGVDIELRLARSTEPKRKERIGGRSTRTYVGAGVRVFAVYVTTRMCKPNEEDCEATLYDATLTVTKGARKQTIWLKGACGC